jgi:hypothetical protein
MVESVAAIGSPSYRPVGACWRGRDPRVSRRSDASTFLGAVLKFLGSEGVPGPVRRLNIGPVGTTKTRRALNIVRQHDSLDTLQSGRARRLCRRRVSLCGRRSHSACRKASCRRDISCRQISPKSHGSEQRLSIAGARAGKDLCLACEGAAAGCTCAHGSRSSGQCEGIAA